jgi:hypothetical protein
VNVHLIVFGLIFIFVVLVLPGGIVQITERWRWRVPRSHQVVPKEEVVT